MLGPSALFVIDIAFFFNYEEGSQRLAFKEMMTSDLKYCKSLYFS